MCVFYGFKKMEKKWWVVIGVLVLIAGVIGTFSDSILKSPGSEDGAWPPKDESKSCRDDKDCNFFHEEEDAKCEDGMCTCKDEEYLFCVFEGCVDWRNDIDNCGGCYNRCDGLREGYICFEGRCTCPSDDLTYCDPWGCVDTTSDVFNCGGCNLKCPPSHICINSECFLRSQGIERAENEPDIEKGVGV
jgi:hypothetical protein